MVMSTLRTRTTTRIHTKITGNRVNRSHMINYVLFSFCCIMTEEMFSKNNDKYFQEGVPQKREYRDEEGNKISRKRSKKLKRIARRPNRTTLIPKRSSDRCHACPNPLVSLNTFKI